MRLCDWFWSVSIFVCEQDYAKRYCMHLSKIGRGSCLHFRRDPDADLDQGAF